MRLRHRKRHSRRNQAKRTGIFSRGNCSSRTILARPNRRAATLGADQPFDRCGGPAVTMVAARTALYRRCSARDVAYRRGRDQSRDSGRGGHGEHTRPKTLAKNSLRKRALRRPATEEFPDSGHAGTSNRHSKQCHPAGPWQRKTVDPSVASEAASPLANSATDSCARNWGRVPSRAREDSRSSNCGQRGINPCSFLNHRRADGELTPTCPDGIPRMPKRLSWRSSCLGFSGPNIFQKAGCSLNVARSSCWTEWELISALPLPVAVHDRF